VSACPAFPFPLPAGAVAGLPTGQLGDRKLDVEYVSSRTWGYARGVSRQVAARLTLWLRDAGS
jgi:hypothetical protein